jgi:ferredoxin
MPTVTAEGREPFEVEAGVRLVNALERHGVDILHRCGGFARCTTCRVEFLEGEPARMTEAEKIRLEAKGLFGQVRLSCQIPVEGDMKVKPLLRLSESDLPDPGATPEEQITPEPVWLEAPTP